ncbi:MAG: ATP-binding protein [Candidatus Tectimicrobiota bacterium]
MGTSEGAQGTAQRDSLHEARTLWQRCGARCSMGMNAALTSLGAKLTGLLFLGFLVVVGLDLYLSARRIQEDLLQDVQREVAAMTRTLRVTMELLYRTERPETHFAALVSTLSRFENMLDVVFYNRLGQVVARSTPLQEHQLPAVDIQQVIATRTAVDGLFMAAGIQRYYRVEALDEMETGEVAAMLVLEDFPFFTRVRRERLLVAAAGALLLLVMFAGIVALVVRRSIAQPLQSLTRQVEAIGQGQFSQPLPTARRDEIGRLAQEFHRMCRRLEGAYRTLETEHAAKLALERDLRQAEQLATLGKLASRLAHEIGTPLNVIQGRAEQLLRRERLPEKDRAFLEVIVSQIERISGFITQLLAPARRSEPHLRVVQLADILRRVWEVVSDRGAAAHVHVTLDVRETLPPVLGDPEQLQQVLLNLSVNAMHAVGAHGQVSLRARWQPQGTLSPAGQVEMEVADTGPGIPAHDLPHIFEPFFTTKSVTGGTGLGLTISREIVRSHHGEIHVESQVGQGTRFIVALPLASPPMA